MTLSAQLFQPKEVAMTTINAAYKSDDPRGRAMSNLSHHPFVLDGVWCGSVEGFIQGIKFAPDDPRRGATLKLQGVPAWKMRTQAQGGFIWWNGEQIAYRSQKHSELIRRAIEAKFAQNLDAFEALLATRGLTIIHETGHLESPTTTLTAVAYCAILTTIRDTAD
jgi:predicted NAD-dependent protein-ADP-ribosyltransferase YbiA (DUF1768 family)